MSRCAGYGLALAFAFLTAVSAAAAAAQERVLYNFGNGRDGSAPNAGLIADAKGVLYGTTRRGGYNRSCPSRLGCGTVFALSPPAAGETGGTHTVLYSFRGPDGSAPFARLIADAKGVLYGTTEGGGGGGGTVFALSPPAAGETRWTETVLHRFHGRDGSNPLAGLIADAKGVLYGTTEDGGDTSCSVAGFPPGCGTVFALSPPAAGETGWTETVLHRFGGGRDGSLPRAGLIADAKGVLYGTTQYGGGTSCSVAGSSPGCGMVFALSPPAAGETRWIETVLHRFRGPDGSAPLAGLIADAKGSILYGTTADGGYRSCPSRLGCGTVFALSPPAAGEIGWTHTVLYSFRGPDGSAPLAGLIADAKGVLYGTTEGGGDNKDGTVFALSPPAAGETRWTETVLHRFHGRDGSHPWAGLIAGTNGVLYGTTHGGGEGYGTVFALSLPAAGGTR
jgi:uncharacterized repeat protein (TIGR03803 family)